MQKTTNDQSVTLPVFQQIKITSDKKRMNHIIPAETLHDRLDWAGLKVMGGGAGQIKCQQSETWESRNNTDAVLVRTS